MTSDADRVTALAAVAATADKLATKVDELAEELAEERANVRGQRRVLRIAVAGLVLALVLSGLAVAGYLRQKDTTRALAAVVAEQDRQNSEAFCPLFRIFVNSYNPNGIAAREQGLPAYDATFVEIRRQYAALRCVTPAPAFPPPKPSSLGPPIGDLLTPPPGPGPVAFSLPARSVESAPHRTVQRYVTRVPTQRSNRKSRSSKSGGKSDSPLRSVTKALPKPKVKVGADVKLGPVKAKVRLHIP